MQVCGRGAPSGRRRNPPSQPHRHARPPHYTRVLRYRPFHRPAAPTAPPFLLSRISPPPPRRQVMAQLQEDIDDCDRRGGRDAALPGDERTEDFATIVAAAEGGDDVRDAVAPLLAGG